MEDAGAEARLAAALAEELARSDAFARWFFGRALPGAHPLTEELGTLRPEIAGVRVEPGGGLVEVMYRHAAPAWTLRFVLAHHAGTPLTAAEAAGARARAAGAVRGGECGGACVVLLSPRRVARDNANTDSFHRVVTYESIGEHLALPGDDPADDARRAALGREFFAAAVGQARATAAREAGRSRGYWASYDGVLGAYAAHLRVVKRGAEPGSDVWFDPGVAGAGAGAGGPRFELVHQIRAARAVLRVTEVGADAAGVAARMMPEMPGDLYLTREGAGLLVWQRVPPLRGDVEPAAQANDLRHAFMLLWRLKNWRRSTQARWGEWVGGPAGGGAGPEEAAGP